MLGIDLPGMEFSQVLCLSTTKPTNTWIGGPKIQAIHEATSLCATFWPSSQALRRNGAPLAGVQGCPYQEYPYFLS